MAHSVYPFGCESCNGTTGMYVEDNCYHAFTKTTVQDADMPMVRYRIGTQQSQCVETQGAGTNRRTGVLGIQPSTVGESRPTPTTT